MDPRQSVRPGDPIALAAAQVNGLNRLLATAGGFGGVGSAVAEVPYSWVLARNTTASTLARWRVASISGLSVTPTSVDTAAATQQFQRMPIVSLAAWSSTTVATAVTVEPIPAGGIGRVAVAGIVQVRAADLWKVPGSVLYADENWGLLQLGAGFRVGTIAATWAKGTTATVTQQQGDGTAISGSPTFTARNHYATITVSGTKRVGCALAGATWVLVAAEC